MIPFSIAPRSLHQLRRRLLAAGPGVAADIMQEAGFATGEALGAAWTAHVRGRTGLADGDALDAAWFGPLFGELASTFGWGTLTSVGIADRAIALASPDWAEAEPSTTQQPACYFTCGCLAAFLTAQAGAPLAVLEVECRSRGDAECVFLAASAETLGAVYDLVTAGGHWREAFAAA